ncbi:OsmC family protein [Agromyces seonyuensis]|uniref:Osmotically inducible protein C n=1 Tax=Agromyces seonyuensis TaxID=2662446 RepID=A0A6I4NY23_9MICO|nr:OsmC family protein [Agromyces seonyuensis]MWB99193.1 osmotically inducible protein C [Agromyces seonyuensis]
MERECEDPESELGRGIGAPVHVPTDNVAHGSVSVARTGERTFEGRNESGTSILIGPAGTPGHFSPGELLKLALAGCAGMSADRGIARRLGEDAAVTVWVHGASNAENRYDRVVEEIVLDLGGLDDDARATLERVIRASIDRGCTVERSIGEQIDVAHAIVDAAVEPGHAAAVPN